MTSNMLMTGDLVRVSYLDRPETFHGRVLRESGQFVVIESGAHAHNSTFECMNGQFWMDDDERISTIEVIDVETLCREASQKAQAWMLDRLSEAMGVQL